MTKDLRKAKNNMTYETKARYAAAKVLDLLAIDIAAGRSKEYLINLYANPMYQDQVIASIIRSMIEFLFLDISMKGKI